jgi:hypothetical protein
LAWSRRRPGVATTTDGPARSARTLRVESDAAVDRGRPDAAVGAVRSEACLDLEGELARRGEDEDADRRPVRLAAVAGRRTGHDRLAVGEALEDRQHEGRGLAGAGLGAGEQVAAGENERDRLALDGRRLGVTLVGDRTEELGREPE